MDLGLLRCLGHGLSFKRNIFGKFYSHLIVVLVMEEVPQSEKLEEYVPHSLLCLVCETLSQTKAGFTEGLCNTVKTTAMLGLDTSHRTFGIEGE